MYQSFVELCDRQIFTFNVESMDEDDDKDDERMGDSVDEGTDCLD